MNKERTFKVEWNDGKKDGTESVKATSHSEAVRFLFPSGEISLSPVEIISFTFVAKVDGATIKGEVKQARRDKTNDDAE